MTDSEPLGVHTVTLVPAVSVRHDYDASWESGFFIVCGAMFVAAAILLALEVRKYRVSRNAIRKFGQAVVAGDGVSETDGMPSRTASPPLTHDRPALRSAYRRQPADSTLPQPVTQGVTGA